MTIILNGEACEVTASVLAEALAELGYGTACIATAVNGAFVTAASRASTMLNAGDAVEVVAPRQGG
jgi:sulfur carrier protein